MKTKLLMLVLLVAAAMSGCATTSAQYVRETPNGDVPFSWESGQCHTFMIVSEWRGDAKMACPRFFIAMRRGEYRLAADVVEKGDFAGADFGELSEKTWFASVLRSEHQRLVGQGDSGTEAARQLRESFHADWLLPDRPPGESYISPQ